MNWLKEKADFKRRVRDVLAEFERQAGSAGPPDFQGAATANPLEHVTRRHVIDHVLMALGWNFDRMNEDMIEEARVRGESTLFLDYLGVTPERRVPRLIVEAKAWAKPPVSASSVGASEEGANVRNTRAALLALALQHIKAGRSREESPITLEWTDWLIVLRDYVGSLHKQSGHLVARVAITSGRWLVIFVDPETAFLRGEGIPAETIQIFDRAEIVEESDGIFDLLARIVLVDDVPTIIRPSQLPAFVNSQSVARAFRALWITRMAEGAHFQIRPQVILNVALVIERADDVLLTIIDDQLPNTTIPHAAERLNDHIAETTALSDQLIAQVDAELQITTVLFPVKDFQGFKPRVSRSVSSVPGATAHSVTLIKPWPSRPDEFLLVLGKSTHYLQARAAIDPCGFHEWSVSRLYGRAQGANPISARSVEPAAFFFDGELHHCAHRTVHDRRADRCQIRPFEEYLCCRTCTLQQFCWNEASLAALPCGTAGPRTTKVPAANVTDEAAEPI